jgi:hypothetical protein
MQQAIHQPTFAMLLANADSATLALQEYVAKSGADRTETSDAVTRFVAAEQKIGTRKGQRGLTFNATGKAFKAADNRRTYLMNLIYKVPRSTAAKRGETDPVEAIIKRCLKLTAAQRRRIRAAI